MLTFLWISEAFTPSHAGGRWSSGPTNGHHRILQNSPLGPEEIARLSTSYEQALGTIGLKDRRRPSHRNDRQEDPRDWSDRPQRPCGNLWASGRRVGPPEGMMRERYAAPCKRSDCRPSFANCGTGAADPALATISSPAGSRADDGPLRRQERVPRLRHRAIWPWPRAEGNNFRRQCRARPGSSV